MPEPIETGDIVTINGNRLTWTVERIFDRIEPLGVRMFSGLTNRIRYESYANLRLFKKGNAAE